MCDKYRVKQEKEQELDEIRNVCDEKSKNKTKGLLN